jgi:hypothetical protein
MNSQVGQMLQKADGFNAMSPEEQKNRQQSLTSSAAMAGAYKENGEDVRAEIANTKAQIVELKTMGNTAMIKNAEVVTAQGGAILGGLVNNLTEE